MASDFIKTEKNYIWVTFQKEGIHKYPAALTDPKLKTGDEMDVSFLGYLHRHIFHFRVEIEVFHDDRDIEFIQFKRELESLYAEEGAMTLDYQSCEMIARELAESESASRSFTVGVLNGGCRRKIGNQWYNTGAEHAIDENIHRRSTLTATVIF